ncbi:hypothetical protein CYY_003444 [Polysphondylium violaceum]|uniref:Transmembrane protein n=1 Tax=Polysphondylium violaceum TaxID=133409 RepID=A0A8J4V187_9MYCE|nr:hypothetical protein CYY_003444 [Polysphondylium violaceum]
MMNINLLFYLLISCIISYFVSYTIDLWRLRLEIYPVIKRFYTYYYHLLSRQQIIKSRKPIDECFIDEFGWRVLIKGVSVDILIGIITQFCLFFFYDPLLLWKSKPYQFYQYQLDQSNNNINNNDNDNNIDIWIKGYSKYNTGVLLSLYYIIVASFVVGLITGILQYYAQYYKIKLQFQLDDKLIPQHKSIYRKVSSTLSCLNSSSSLPLISKSKKRSFQQLYFQNINITKKEVNNALSHKGTTAINAIYNMLGDSIVFVFYQILFYLVFLTIFALLSQYQMYSFLEIVSTRQQQFSQPQDSFNKTLFLQYVLDYMYYRSPVIVLITSSILSVLITHPVLVYQTQLEAFQFSFILLCSFFKNDNDIDNSGQENNDDTLAFPVKFQKIYQKNKWKGFIGRSLFITASVSILSLWFDFFYNY